MAPPAYGDLGRQARDVFGKGYHFGLFKLDVKTKSESGVEFSTGTVSNQENGKVNGNLETKYKLADYGITFTEKWNTDNVLCSEVTIQDQIAKGLKITANAVFTPPTGNKTAQVKASYTHEACAVNADVDIRPSGPQLTASTVLGYQGFVGGYQTKFDLRDSKLLSNNFALGFSNDEFVLHAAVRDGQDFSGSIFHKVKPDLEAAVDLLWSAGSNDTRFGIGCKYDLDKEASIRAKVNNSSQVGLSYEQRLRKGVTITLSTLIDAKNFNQGGHKLGLALNLEA